MGTNDQLVIEAVLAGDTGAYESLVKAHASILQSVALKITRNQADAEEVVQEAFLRAYRNLSRFDARSSFRTWIYRITVRCALDRLEAIERERKRTYSPPVTEDEPIALDLEDAAAGPDRWLLSGEISAFSKMALDSLSPLERTAFLMRHHDEASGEEIAEALGISINAVKQAVFRAVHKLRSRLRPLREKNATRGNSYAVLQKIRPTSK